MTQQSQPFSSEKSQQLLEKLRRSRLELAESNLELDEISARLEQELRQQKLRRVRQKLECK